MRKNEFGIIQEYKEDERFLLMKKDINQEAVDNFMNTIDRNENIHVHAKNAIRDSFSYLWSYETLLEIMTRLNEVYDEKRSV
jgi:predicted metal-dependent hydrolase